MNVVTCSHRVDNGRMLLLRGLSLPLQVVQHPFVSHPDEGRVPGRRLAVHAAANAGDDVDDPVGQMPGLGRVQPVAAHQCGDALRAVRRRRPVPHQRVAVGANRAELPHRVREIPYRFGHEDAVPVDEGHGSSVPEHGVARSDVPVAHDLPLGDRLRPLLVAGVGREALRAAVVGPQQLAHRSQRVQVELPRFRVSRDPALDPGQHNTAVGPGAHHTRRPTETGLLQVHERLPHRLAVRRSRTFAAPVEHRVAERGCRIDSLFAVAGRCTVFPTRTNSVTRPASVSPSPASHSSTATPPSVTACGGREGAGITWLYLGL